ncbi:sensor histidine kinase [Flavobacterium phycosphaerae]|uniref:sensor histidine kinase n=1 Tax=Flavobacterium phycosphaerae TaxID=2697515 RepID=UPI0013895F97|nr:sensor histidine kinase [Flavobacterium phycosphaerae]
MEQAGVFYNKKEYKKAIQLLKEADKVPITIYVKNIKSRIHMYLSNNYSEIGDFEKAYNELMDYLETNNQDVFEKQNQQITDLQTRYETKEKELENLNLKVKDKNNRLLIFMFLALFVIVSFIGFFRIKILSKKKQIAEQERLIESQKLENVLQQQELKEIDKLLEGQEKERIKIANELHDNLGSLMATLKLNFQNLKLRADSNEESNQLFDKTDDLLEEAYQKVRGIAHAKNAGVIANEGLLPAILNIAKKASVTGKLNVQVIPFGLDERLENTIEVTIFRMIQEILTNAIKHAKATEITIHLTQHQDSLNIIVEDNGKGFNAKSIEKNEGMGLPNIEKKVEHMGGTFTIDSAVGRGSSIIIDIPL